jgi:hypothetical protein
MVLILWTTFVTAKTFACYSQTADSFGTKGFCLKSSQRQDLLSHSVSFASHLHDSACDLLVMESRPKLAVRRRRGPEYGLGGFLILLTLIVLPTIRSFFSGLTSNVLNGDQNRESSVNWDDGCQVAHVSFRNWKLYVDILDGRAMRTDGRILNA